MKTLLRTSVVVIGMIVGISAVSALPAPIQDTFNWDAFWSDIN